MALHDGFFDAVLDEDTQKYDREYGSDEFTEYFGQIIGSGVCIHDNPDSLKVRLENGAAVVSPGYLFIRGYWLKNDADYTVPLASSGTLAILAHLNTGQRLIEIEAQSLAQAYPDSLVLAFVNAADGVAEDTRDNQALCGKIDTAGSLSDKVTYALHYIDNEIDKKLEQAEADIAKQSALLDEKIKEVQGQVERIAPPPIGTIKFSASPPGDGWLKCDGSFIQQTKYPELSAILKKYLSIGSYSEHIGEMDSEWITNGCPYDGRMWYFLIDLKKLVGINDKNGEIDSIINVNGADIVAQRTTGTAILSVAEGAVYLAQDCDQSNGFLLEYIGDLQNGASITMDAIDISQHTRGYTGICVPHVVYHKSDAKYRMTLSTVQNSKVIYAYEYPLAGECRIYYLEWTEEGAAAATLNFFKIEPELVNRQNSNSYLNSSATRRLFATSFWAYHPKNNGELLANIEYLFGMSNSSDVGTSGGINNWASASSLNYLYLYWKLFSAPSFIYGDFVNIDSDSGNIISEGVISRNKFDERYGNNPFAVRYIPEMETDTRTVIPVASETQFLYNAKLSNRRISIAWGEMGDVFQWEEIDVQLPTRANLFQESLLYMSTQGIWFIFVGTGLLFSDDLSENNWGYLDLQSVLGGIISHSGCCHSSGNALFLSGIRSDGKCVAIWLDAGNPFDYSSDGAWLPSITSDGVPAYIKAKETEA